jgi:hypothetical protein
VVRPPIQFASKTGPGAVYRVAQACFTCRRSFKIAGHPPGEAQPDARCPGCGASLKWMGRTFRTPKQSDIAEWKKVEALWNEGFRFFSFRSFPDAERMPTALDEVADFVRRNPCHPFRVAEASRTSG